MNYVDIVNLVFQIIFTICGLLYAHFIIFFITGLFAKKKFPKAKEKHKYAILVSARNEEYVIGNLIKSIQKNNYPQDNLHIFIVAHNCTDNTADVCRKLGVTVYEYNNPNEKTKGYALKYLIDRISEDYGIEAYDGYYVFDADNIVNKDYFDLMNDAFEACGCKNTITSFRNSKNFGQNIMSGLYGIYFMTGCRLEMRGRTVLNCSTRVSGTGYVISSSELKNGWPYVTLTEDWELTADQIVDNNKVIYCDDAEFYDEQPTTFKVMWRQRIRWSRGHLLICVTRLKDLIKSLFSNPKKHRHKVSIYDNIANILPFCLLLTTLGIVQFAMLLFAPLAGLEFWPTMLNWAKGIGISLAVGYIASLANAIIVFIAERKRIQGVKWWQKILISLAWPFFLGIQFFIDVVALFNKNCGWKTIPHDNTTTFEDLHKDHISEEKSEDVVVENATETSSTIENPEV